MNAYEKCLLYWTEVHMFGFEVERTYPLVPFHRVRFEDLIGAPEATGNLLRFLEIPHRQAWGRAVNKPVDQYRLTTPSPIEASRIWSHETTLRVARRCGTTSPTLICTASNNGIR